jgi:hypothetical protein
LAKKGKGNIHPSGNVIKLGAFNCLALQGKDKMLKDCIGFSPKKQFG